MYDIIEMASQLSTEERTIQDVINDLSDEERQFWSELAPIVIDPRIHELARLDGGPGGGPNWTGT